MIKNKIIFLIFLVFTAGFLLARPASAVELYLSASKETFQPEEKFLVSIFLNTENDSINAIEGRIIFPKDILALEEIRDGDSLITFWLERPRTAANEIVFSGIIPGGYFDKKGLVFSMVFQAKQAGNGSIDFSDAKVLLNDGQGTAAKLSMVGLPLAVIESSGVSSKPEEIVLPIKDDDPPELFTPAVAQDPTLFNGQSFLVFATQDKGSGIDYYEVKEGLGRFVKATSPYLLINQRLNNKITVRAVDKAGNERLAVLPAPNPWPLYQKIIFSAIIIVVISLIYIIGGILWKRCKKSKIKE
ncbi:MAG: hypothetical protein V1692_02040 [bacterium]